MTVGARTHDTCVESRVADTIRLTIPVDERFRPVPTLVLGGIGTRLDLPFERIDDLQLAVLSMLDAIEGDEATVEVEVEDDAVSVSVGPLQPQSADDRGLHRVLSRLVDDHEPAVRGNIEWMTLRLARMPSPSP